MESEILTQFHKRVVMDFLDALILLKLRNGMLSDYEILSYIQRRFNVPITLGTVYSCLNQLQENKLVREVQSEKERGYVLTPTGKKKTKAVLNMRDKILGLVANL
ncbi:MAG: hypothetical protein QXU38_03590, partial [Candidatus Bathyarchaeia archaeon]